jgi:hypothetical protein
MDLIGEWVFTHKTGATFLYSVVGIRDGLIIKGQYALTECKCKLPPDHISPPGYVPTGALLETSELRDGKSLFGTWTKRES